MKTLNFNFISIHPRFIESYFAFGVFKSAITKNLVEIHNVDLRKYAVDEHGSIDDKPYGGGEGMVLRPEPLKSALAEISSDARVILLSPKGTLCTQAEVTRLHALANEKPMVFVCGRFGGVDQRFIDAYVDEEISMGDFIVSGGELPALMLADAILRHVPGVLGHGESAVKDSFGPGLGGKMEYPLYTRPQEFEGVEVPEVLLSGDHKAIEKWRSENLT